jgi:hypothetical protein
MSQQMEKEVPAIGCFSSHRAEVNTRSFQFSVAVLRCGHLFIGWWHSDGLDVGECVGDVMSTDVSHPRK